MEGVLYNRYSHMTADSNMIIAFTNAVKDKVYLEQNIVGILNSITNFSWSYNVEHEEKDPDTNYYSIRVSLYIPGRVMQGVSTSQISKSYKEENIRVALADALIKMFYIDNKYNTNNSINPPQEPEPHFNKVGPGVDIPSGPVGQAPQKAPNGLAPYTQKQVDAMLKFKADFNITTDEQLMAHVKTWNPAITEKGMLNGDNLDGFLEYVSKLGEVGF